jgi:MarR family transcriptional regulator, transcriptional regulator for hemolysin
VTKPEENPQLTFIRECVLLGRRWRAYYDERIRQTGLTLARVTVLYWIDALDGATTQRELADIVGIEGPTLVRQLHALEGMGLIERVPAPGDRRAKAIRLTAAAEPVLRMIHENNDRLSKEAFDRLDRRRLASATKLVQDARAALG